MGVIKFFSSSSFDLPKRNQNVVYQGNPNPKNYKIVRSESVGGNLIILVNYPGCNNYEGNKILLFKGISMDSIVAQGEIDPHFSDNRFKHSPFARFEPTEDGWKIAIETAKII